MLDDVPEEVREAPRSVLPVSPPRDAPEPPLAVGTRRYRSRSVLSRPGRLVPDGEDVGEDDSDDDPDDEVVSRVDRPLDRLDPSLSIRTEEPRLEELRSRVQVRDELLGTLRISVVTAEPVERDERPDESPEEPLRIVVELDGLDE